MTPSLDENDAAPRIAVRRLALVCCVLSVPFLLSAFLPFTTVRARLDAVAYDKSAEPYTPDLHARLQAASLGICIVLLSMSAVLWFGPSSWFSACAAVFRRIRREALEAGADLIASIRDEWLWLSIVIIVALGMRLIWIEQPIRYDEATSWLDYASPPVFVTVSKYDNTNNHIFHNVCMNLAIRCLGSTPLAIRLTALIAGVLTCVWTAWLAFSFVIASGQRRFDARMAGLLAGLCVAVSSVSIEYSTLGRGYTLLSCAFLFCWLTAREAIRNRSLLLWGLSILSAALGLWAVPLMIYPLVMLSFLLLWDSQLDGPIRDADQAAEVPTLPSTQRQRLRWLVASLIILVPLVAFLYLPTVLVGGVSQLFGNVNVVPMTLNAWLSEWTAAALRGYFLIWRDVPIVVRFLWMFGIISAVTRPDRWSSRLMLVAAFVVPVFLMPLLQRVHPPARSWQFLIPPMAVFASWGWCGRWRSLPATWRGALQAALLTAMVVWPAASILRNDPIAASNETGSAPQARAAAEFLKVHLQPAEPIVAVCPASGPLKYYASRIDIDWVHFDWPMNEQTRDDLAIVAVSDDKEYQQTVDSVLAELNLDDEFAGWSRQEIWSRPGLTLYRLIRP